MATAARFVAPKRQEPEKFVPETASTANLLEALTTEGIIGGIESILDQLDQSSGDLPWTAQFGQPDHLARRKDDPSQY